jgi:hypothetical protein
MTRASIEGVLALVAERLAAIPAGAPNAGWFAIRDQLRDALGGEAHGGAPIEIEGLAAWLETASASTRRILADVEPDSADQIRLKAILDAYGHVADRVLWIQQSATPPAPPVEAGGLALRKWLRDEVAGFEAVAADRETHPDERLRAEHWAAAYTTVANRFDQKGGDRA